MESRVEIADLDLQAKALAISIVTKLRIQACEDWIKRGVKSDNLLYDDRAWYLLYRMTEHIKENYLLWDLPTTHQLFWMKQDAQSSEES